jgi:hypothetical protein
MVVKSPAEKWQSNAAEKALAILRRTAFRGKKKRAAAGPVRRIAARRVRQNVVVRRLELPANVVADSLIISPR